MASKREIKKDIRYLCEQLILDALEVSEIVGENDKQKVAGIVAEIAVIHNELISRTNHPDGKDNPKLVRAYFRAIYNDLLTECNKIYDKLNQLIPAE
jgi:hypothetical protein